MGFFSLLRGSGWSASVRGLPGRPPVRHSDATGRPAVTLSFPQLSRSQQRLSVTAGNWLSQHGGRSATGDETVLPRQNRLFPVWCLPCAVELPTRVKHPHSQGSVASSSARRRAPSAPRGGGSSFSWTHPPLPFSFLGFLAGRPCVILTPRVGRPLHSLFPSSAALSRDVYVGRGTIRGMWRA